MWKKNMANISKEQKGRTTCIAMSSVTHSHREEKFNPEDHETSILPNSSDYSQCYTSNNEV